MSLVKCSFGLYESNITLYVAQIEPFVRSDMSYKTLVHYMKFGLISDLRLWFISFFFDLVPVHLQQKRRNAVSHNCKYVVLF
jgi:hypothetical protein